jgi:C1A family cysteine protease
MIEECDKGHALVIVGYDDETKLFEVRNSWGENWANGGYAYIRYSDMKKLIWYEDSYAVVK